MKKIITFVVALMCLGSVDACVKKRIDPSETRTQPLTVIVMDTTQALLPNAQVKVQREVYTTSFDGRVVLQPEQVTSSTFLVTCEGYKPAHAIVKDAPVLIVRLLPDGKKQKEGNGDLMVRGKGVLFSTTAARYDKAAVSLEVADDAMPANNVVSAGLLTAGEVNDFAKWQLWESVLDSKFAPFIQTWGIEPRQRFTVQVKNQDGYPVVNYPVQLKDAKGNTLFQALTDNTGKAELWGNMLNRSQPSVVREPEKTIILDEPCDAPEGVDVVFVFDATGSMGDELRYLQEEMKDVIARAKEATGGLAIRTGAVVYRDHLYDEYLTRISRLTDDIATTQAFIDKQSANGGGDYPEAVPEALMAALNSAGWSDNARARIAFLILDAPCHEDSATLALLHEQILNAAAMGVRIVPVVCSGIDEKAEYLLRAIALATNGTSFFLTDDSGIGNKHHKPTTDTLKVEHLNDMLVRTIVEFSYMPGCDAGNEANDETLQEQESFLPNPFTAADLETNPTIPHGVGVHYLIDISGKLLGVFEGNVPTDHLPVGVYFIKTYYDGIWHTKKILVH